MNKSMDKIIERRSPKMDLLTASPRIFANSVLDKLSRTHHLFPPLAYFPVVAVLLWFAAHRMMGLTIIATAFAGYLSWTIFEYLGHRFLFHLDMPSPLGKRIHYMIHGVHHDHPSDPLRLVMPPLMSLPILAIAFPALRLIWGPELVLSVYAGFITGYIGYDMLHFHLHHRKPQTTLGRALYRRHMLHHFQDDTSWFGISAPWWDNVFRTAPTSSLDKMQSWHDL